MLLGKLRNRTTRKQRENLENNMTILAAKALLDKSTIKTMYTKEFTMKQWNKLSIPHQQYLTNTYSIILTDHETTKEKWIRRLKLINLKNFDKGMKTFDKGQKQFWKEFDKGFSDAGMKKKGTLYPKKKKNTTRKNNELNIIFGSGKQPSMKQGSKRLTDAVFGSPSKKKTRVF